MRNNSSSRERRFLRISPYNTLETARLVWHNLFIKRRKKKRINPIPNRYILHSGKPLFTIGFLGDIRGTGLKEVNFSENIKNFYSECDWIVANFEGTLYEGKKRTFIDQIITEETLHALEQLANPEKYFLSLANNHSGDFPMEAFEESKDILDGMGFNLFGFDTSPLVELNEHICVHGFSQWTNKTRGWHSIASFKDFEELIPDILEKNRINILYPHWGQENELYPRKYIIKKARDYIEYFDAIIGHHSHVPQPVTVFKNRLIAYSLGDVSYKSDKFPYNKECYGINLKLGIGKNPNFDSSPNVICNEPEWVIMRIEWSYTRCNFDYENELYIDSIRELPW